MDWTQTKTIAEANLDAITGKASSPRVALQALEKKITAEVDKVEGQLTALDARVNALPGLLDAADQMVLKVEHVVAKAKAEGRADLVAAAMQRGQKTVADRAALQAEFDVIDAQQTEADEWLTKLQDKLVEVQARIDKYPETAPAPAAPASAPAASPASPPKTAAPAPGPSAPSAAKPAPGPAAAPGKPPASTPAGKGKDALDDEFASLLKDLDVDLAKVELPKKKGALAPLPDSDDGIPDLVTVADNELPDGEELPPLEAPKKGAAPAPQAPAKGAAPSAAKPGLTAAKPGVPATAATSAAKQTAAAKSDAPAKKSRAWLWISSSVVVVGGGGAALAHFVLHLF